MFIDNLKSATVYKLRLNGVCKTTDPQTGKTSYTTLPGCVFSVCTRPDYAKLSKLSKPAKKTAKVTWKKVSRASGYKVVASTNYKLTKPTKTYYVKGTSKKITGLKSGKWYYLAVIPYKTFNGKKIYSRKKA